jgi:hypothetical protein
MNLRYLDTHFPFHIATKGKSSQIGEARICVGVQFVNGGGLEAVSHGKTRDIPVRVSSATSKSVR